MRPVGHGDVTAAACALLRVPAEKRAHLLARLLAEAETADAYRRETGRLHPLWGNGSLMGAAMGHARAREPFLDEPEYAACMAMVFEALVVRGDRRGADKRARCRAETGAACRECTPRHPLAISPMASR